MESKFGPFDIQVMINLLACTMARHTHVQVQHRQTLLLLLRQSLQTLTQLIGLKWKSALA
jgi:hypothetical protein